MGVEGLRQRLNEIRDRHLENDHTKEYIDELDSQLESVWKSFLTESGEEYQSLNFLDYFMYKELDTIKKNLIRKAKQSARNKNK